MFYKHNYKKEEEEKKEGFLQKLFQKLKEISFYSYMLSFLIAVLLLILFLIYLEKRSRDLKVPQTVVKTQLVSKEKFSKNEEISMNVKISGNPEIIEKLNFNITNNSNINLKKNTIQIKLDNNRDNNSVLSLQINHEVLTKDELVNDETLLTIEYVESYAD